MSRTTDEQLALHGGTPVRTEPLLPAIPAAC